ncbi:hypothetical protein JOC45_004206 [Gordonia hydrophobica]|nr:hypothetical protein [Gordonia hydrophobica]
MSENENPESAAEQAGPNPQPLDPADEVDDQAELNDAEVAEVVEAVGSMQAAIVDDAEPADQGEPVYMSYEEFGRSFFEIAVTEERIGTAFTAIAGEEFEVGPIASGPGGMVKVHAKVRVEDPEITRDVGKLITFVVKLPLHIALSVDLKVDRIRYDVDGLVTLPMTVRCAAPLQLRIEVDPPRPRDVFVDVNSRNMRGEIIRNLAQVDDEIRRVIARFVETEIDKPEVSKARLIDVDVELGRAFEGL